MTPEELTRRREGLGMTQAELSERLGVRLNKLSRWERGDNWPAAEGMLELAMDQLEMLHATDFDPLIGQIEERIDRLKGLRNELAKMQRSAREK
jgi:transcriptional regulator with XRE-family HTH domain